MSSVSASDSLGLHNLHVHTTTLRFHEPRTVAKTPRLPAEIYIIRNGCPHHYHPTDAAAGLLQDVLADDAGRLLHPADAAAGLLQDEDGRFRTESCCRRLLLGLTLQDQPGIADNKRWCSADKPLVRYAFL